MGLSGFFSKRKKPTPQPQPRNPLDRRWADSPIVNQENGIQCSAITVTGAMDQWLNVKANVRKHPELDWQELWGTQKFQSNLSAALTYAGMYGVGGYKIEQTPLFEPAIPIQLLEWVQANLKAGYSLVCEMRQGSELNHDGVIASNQGDIYGSWHAMLISAIVGDHIVCKNSFGTDHGERGYKYIAPQLMVRSGVKLYAVTSVKR